VTFADEVGISLFIVSNSTATPSLEGERDKTAANTCIGCEIKLLKRARLTHLDCCIADTELCVAQTVISASMESFRDRNEAVTREGCSSSAQMIVQMWQQNLRNAIRQIRSRFRS
jgi:hypothetical protein